MKKPTKQVKRILYVFRALMTGINLMRTGVVESNILRFNADLKLSYVPELFAQKVRGYENGELAEGHTLDFYSKEYVRLQERLADERGASPSPVEAAQPTHAAPHFQ